MAGIDLKGFDPWPQIGGAAGGGIGGASGVLGTLAGGGDWLSLGMNLLGGMFSGDVDQSAAGSLSAGQLNTSGWVVGQGDAQGGDSSQSSSLSTAAKSMPEWLLWLGGAAVIVIVLRRV